jgi:D-alanyl-D-alanine carboxypeptidase
MIQRNILVPCLFALYVALVPEVRAETPPPVSPIPDQIWSFMQGTSWHANLPCPKRDELRLVDVPYLDFTGAKKSGYLIIDKALAEEVHSIFTEIYLAGNYRIETMKLIDAYGGDDFKSIEANNTSAFNCRFTTGAKTMSAHAKGRAIDINPLINPYVDKSGTSHAKSKGFVSKLQRAKSSAHGMIQPEGIVVKTFKKYGWKWGGDWKNIKDYQHFSKDGR